MNTSANSNITSLLHAPKNGRMMKIRDLTRLLDAEVGKHLRELRGNAGRSQDDLATMLDITFQQIQKYEKGQNPLTVARLLLIARTLNVSAIDFIAALEQQMQHSLGAPDTDEKPDDSWVFSVSRNLRAIKCKKMREVIAVTIRTAATVDSKERAEKANKSTSSPADNTAEAS